MPRQPEPAALDVSQLRPLYVGARGELIELIDDSVRAIGTLIERLTVAAESHTQAARAVAHELKGLSGNIGALEVAAMAARCDDLATHERWGDLAAELSPLAVAQGRLCSAAAAFAAED